MNKLTKRSQMLSLIASFHSSGKDKKTFCIEQGIKQSTFYYWLSRSQEESLSSGSFIPIDKSTVKAQEIEVIYPNGVRLKIARDLALASQLIHLY